MLLCLLKDAESTISELLSWFSLWAKPNQTLTEQEGTTTGFNKDSSGNSVVLTPFSSSHSSHITNQSTIIDDPEIYIIGGPSKEPLSSVRILDCRNHTWRDAPSMIVAREDACAIFCDDKIYVMGGCDIDEDFANWMEVFDMKTQSWKSSFDKQENKIWYAKISLESRCNGREIWGQVECVDELSRFFFFEHAEYVRCDMLKLNLSNWWEVPSQDWKNTESSRVKSRASDSSLFFSASSFSHFLFSEVFSDVRRRSPML
ncbi:unnamed protein product [Microthlaspi erraticum]|uniref:FKB95-like N-terminal Kelch domain-containing protein n=1 Tax=Microthlaspi erraticum TaxID=1685480 RepID=A0A6D2IVW6_9BRAS|nr:unnamed protein product [Microthlaspi erraticum]